MSPEELVERMSEYTPEGVTERDRRQLDVLEIDRS